MRRRRKDRAPVDEPGPGNYDLPEDERRGFTIGQKKEEKIPMGPGPGQYQHHDHVGRDAPAVSIRGRPEERIPEDMPGPGFYPDYSPEKTGGALITGRPASPRASDIPGPGAYDSPERMNKTGGWTIGQRRADRPRESVPGPGEYEPLKVEEVGHSFSHLDRESTGYLTESLKKQTPGPGQY